MNNYSDYIIALDLDDTLLNSQGEISDFTIKTILECKRMGFKIVISSTRGYGACSKFADIIQADYVCCQAGNMIIDNKKNIVYSHPFTTEELSCFINHFSKYTQNLIIDSDDNLYGVGNTEFANSWGVVHRDINELKHMTAYKICAHYTKDYKQEMLDYCKKHNFICREMRGNDFMMLISPPDSDKYFALRALMQILNLDSSNLLVFGDDHSDILSIQKAGFGVAMANSKPEVLQIANYKTLSNDNDGVAIFLKDTFNF